jgi:hypothetical protein
MTLRSIASSIIWLCLSLSPALADQAAEKSAATAAQAWLGEIDAGNYAKSWKEASTYFQGAMAEKNWTDALTGTRKPLGKLISRKLGSAQSTTSLPGAPDGNYVVMQFETSFGNKKSAVETVTFVQEKDGKWKAVGYYIK